MDKFSMNPFKVGQIVFYNNDPGVVVEIVNAYTVTIRAPKRHVYATVNIKELTREIVEIEYDWYIRRYGKIESSGVARGLDSLLGYAWQVVRLEPGYPTPILEESEDSTARAHIYEIEGPFDTIFFKRVDGKKLTHKEENTIIDWLEEELDNLREDEEY
jgi:hypothetical protein